MGTVGEDEHRDLGRERLHELLPVDLQVEAGEAADVAAAVGVDDDFFGLGRVAEPVRLRAVGEDDGVWGDFLGLAVGVVGLCRRGVGGLPLAQGGAGGPAAQGLAEEGLGEGGVLVGGGEEGVEGSLEEDVADCGGRRVWLVDCGAQAVGIHESDAEHVRT